MARRGAELDAPLADQALWWQEQARECLQLARDADDISSAAALIGRGIGCLDMLAKLTGAYAPTKLVVGSVNGPDWAELRTVIFDALQAYPSALESVTSALGAYVERKSKELPP